MRASDESEPTPAHPSSLEWDCHVHVFGALEKYPVIKDASYQPPDAPLALYHAEAHSAGLKHCVYVQPSIYGADNRALLDALAKSQGHHRAIVEPSADWTPDVLEKLHMAGVRGLRLNLLSKNSPPSKVSAINMRDLADVLPHLAVVRSLGWHIAAHIDVTVPGVLLHLSEALPNVPIVLDHFGRPPRGAVVPPYYEFAALYEGLESGQVYVKFSAPYQFSKENPPYQDVGALAIRLLKTYPTRILFGSNWPHVGGDKTIPSVQELISSIAEWAKAASTPLVRLDANARQLYL